MKETPQYTPEELAEIERKASYQSLAEKVYIPLENELKEQGFLQPDDPNEPIYGTQQREWPL